MTKTEKTFNSGTSQLYPLEVISPQVSGLNQPVVEGQLYVITESKVKKKTPSVLSIPAIMFNFE